jgi:hypothetical protein
VTAGPPAWAEAARSPANTAPTAWTPLPSNTTIGRIDPDFATQRWDMFPLLKPN